MIAIYIIPFIIIFNGKLCGGWLMESLQAFQEGIAPYLEDLFKVKVNLPDDPPPRRCGELYDICRLESDCCPENQCMMTANDLDEGIVNMCFPKDLRTKPISEEVITVKGDDIIVARSTQKSVATKFTVTASIPNSTSIDGEKSEDITNIFTPDLKVNWTPIDMKDVEKLIANNKHLFNNFKMNKERYGLYRIPPHIYGQDVDQNKRGNILSTIDYPKKFIDRRNHTSMIDEKKFKEILNKEYSKAISALHKIHEVFDRISVLNKNINDNNNNYFYPERKRIPRSNDTDQEKYKKFLKYIKKSKKYLKENIKILKNPFPTCIRLLRNSVTEFSKNEDVLPKMFYEIETKLKTIVSNMTDNIRRQITDTIRQIQEDDEATKEFFPRERVLTEKDMTFELELLKLKINIMYDEIVKAVKKYVVKEVNVSDEIYRVPEPHEIDARMEKWKKEQQKNN